jgi:hypothetical protein
MYSSTILIFIRCAVAGAVGKKEECPLILRHDGIILRI